MNMIQKQNNAFKNRKYKKNFIIFFLIATLLLNFPIISRAEAIKDSKAESLQELENKDAENPAQALETDSEQVFEDPTEKEIDKETDKELVDQLENQVEEGKDQVETKNQVETETEEDSNNGLEISPEEEPEKQLEINEVNGVLEVSSFEELKEAVAQAGNKQTTIKIMKAFDFTESLTIAKDQDIILTADNNRREDAWNPIKRPADYADQGEAKQREIIEEARARGQEALDKSDLEKNPLPSADSGDKIIKRASTFADDSLFRVNGKLTLGTEDSAIYIDGNKDQVQTKFTSQGSVITIDGQLTMKNAVIMNSYNKHGYTGPVKVNNGAKFVMESGRISKNTSFEQIDQDYNRPYAAGAVYVKPGGTFIMKNGLIDNNHGGLTGGVFAGDLWGSSGNPAEVTINGGIIANNLSATRYQMGGGLNGFPKSKITMTDGIIAGNKSFGVGGGIGISSQYIGSPSNILGREKASVNTNYNNFIKEHKAEAHIDGGLIYKNRSIASGGGIYVDSNDVKLDRTMILDNEAGQFGGGVYASFPPITQKLEDILITENKAFGQVTSSIIGGSNGGGLWNCPTGFVHIGDGHSVYVYNNDATSYGKDITFSEKTWYFSLNGINIKDEFYSHISPVTKGKNIIKFLEDGKVKEDGVEIPERLSYHSLYTHLRAEYSDALIKEAWSNSKTFVLGNKANNGGGVGSNANITTTKDEGNYEIELNKKWDASIPNSNIPSNIKVNLFIVPLDKDYDYVKANYGKDKSLFKYGEITLGKDNNWHSKFDTNYFNGANKQELLDKLKIKDLSDIGLPDGAYSIDKGLPFTAEELKEKGYKYLAVEQGEDYAVEMVESKGEDKTTVKAGGIEIERIYHDQYDDDTARREKNIYLYLSNPDKKNLTRLGQTKLGESTGGKAEIYHPILLKEISQIKYYGENRKFTEYEGWGSVRGYHNKDQGYAFILTENEDGTLTLEIPYLWVAGYGEGLGFTARKLAETKDIAKEGKTHSFTLTNSEYGKLKVKKTWENIKEKDIPESINLYLRLDGKRIVEKFDENGNPIYKKLSLNKDNNWQGQFDGLYNRLIDAGRYTIEEESGLFAPEFIAKTNEYKIRIGYADTFQEEGQEENHVTSTSGHFRPYSYKNEDGTYRDIKMNLYLEDKLVDQKGFKFNVSEYEGLTFADLVDHVVFESVSLKNHGQPIPVKYYDVFTNEPGLDEYNFYLRKDENGSYALYLPRLVIDGVPYADLFIAEKLEPNPPYDSHERTNLINPLADDEDYQIKVTNHYKPKHEIEISKKWIGGDDNIPEEITVVLTDNEGNSKEIKLTKEEGWKKVLTNLDGNLRNKGYSIKEKKLDNFASEVKTGETILRATGKDVKGKDLTLDYANDELIKVLKEGNYRYEVFELEDKDLEFNLENLDSFIKLEKENDGSYIIKYAKDIRLREVLFVEITNTYTPPQTPPEKTEVAVEKIWEDQNNKDGKRPEKITVHLYRNGQLYQTRKVSAKDGWKVVFTDLDKYEDDKEIIYTVVEEKVEGYTGKVSGNAKDGFVLTNTRKPQTPPEKTEVAVEKIWEDQNNKEGKRPEEITVHLYKNGQLFQTKKISGKDGWKVVFNDLDKYEDGKEILYTIKEEKLEGYTGEVSGNAKDGFVLTNTRKPEIPPKTGDEFSAIYPYMLILSTLAITYIYRKKDRERLR